MTKIICNDIYFDWGSGNHAKLNYIKCCCRIDGYGQNMFTIERNSSGTHQLYIWWDEGDYPMCVDTRLDESNHRKPQITGVDEL